MNERMTAGRIPEEIEQLRYLGVLSLGGNRLAGLSVCFYAGRWYCSNCDPHLVIGIAGDTQRGEESLTPLVLIVSFLFLAFRKHSKPEQHHTRPGPVPSCLGRLCMLQTLSLRGNRLTGSFVSLIHRLSQHVSLRDCRCQSCLDCYDAQARFQPSWAMLQP